MLEIIFLPYNLFYTIFFYFHNDDDNVSYDNNESDFVSDSSELTEKGPTIKAHREVDNRKKTKGPKAKGRLNARSWNSISHDKFFR